MPGAPPDPGDLPPTRGLRVLLVDDRPDNLLALEAVLEPLGVEMATASSGEEALRLLLDEVFAVIVLDVQMPGLDGFETARLIKGREKTRHVPIIFLTAISGALEHHLEGYASGAIDYVYKPFEPEILRAKVAALAELVNTKERLEREVARRRAADLHLADRERRLASAESLAHVGAWSWEVTSGSMLWSDELFRILGLSPQSMKVTYDTYLAAVHPDDRSLVDEAVRGALATSEAYQLEHRIVRPDGTVVRLRSQGQAVRSEGGQLQVFGAAQDVTERRRTEEGLTQFFNLSLHLMAIAGLDGHLRRVNQSFVRLLGWSESELLARPLLDLVHPEDRHHSLEELVGLREGGDSADLELRLLTRDGSWRWLRWSAKPIADEGIAYVVATDVTERRRAAQLLRESQAREEALRHQRDIARDLQQSLLPAQLPKLPDLTCSARYLAGGAGLEVGGDWYDVLPVAGGSIAVAIGDVVGRGLHAAVTMGQLRTGLRAYALEDPSPSKVVPRLDRLAHNLAEATLATLTYAVYDPPSGMLRFMCAGHSPLLVVGADGSARFLEGGRCAPLGLCILGAQEGAVALEPGSLLVLYTDGLVERPEQTLDDGLALLVSVAGDCAGATPDELCDAIMAAMVGTSPPKDDVALLVVSLASAHSDRFRFSGLTQARQLGVVRQALVNWLKRVGATSIECDDIVLAASEAMSNALMHAYGSGEGTVEVEASAQDGQVVVTITDNGVWRSRANSGGGRGFTLMQALVESVHVDNDASGTRVRLQRQLGHPLGSPGTIELPWLDDEDLATGDAADHIAVVALAENIDLSNAEGTGSALARAIGSEQLGLVLDLTAITYLDSSGIRMLYELKRRLEHRRQRLWVVVPPGSPVRRLLEIAPAGTLVPVASSVDQAFSAIREVDVDALFR